MSAWKIILGVILNIIGAYLIIDGTFSPSSGLFVNFGFAYNEIILGAVIFIAGLTFDIIGRAQCSKKS